MKQFCCDLCSKEIQEDEVRVLSDIFAEKNFKELCPECMDELYSINFEIQHYFAKLKNKMFKRAISRRRAIFRLFNSPTPRGGK